MKIRDFVKQHKGASVLASVASIYMFALAIGNIGPDTSYAVAVTIWLITTTWGKAILGLLAVGLTVGYWVVYPWFVENLTRSRIRTLCDRLDAMESYADAKTTGYDFVSVAMTAGAVVIKLRNELAFRSDPVLEERLDMLMRRQSLVQAGCKNPNDPAAQGEYQAFWAARQVAARRMGDDGECPISADRVKSGCALVSDHVRDLWNIPRPMRGVKSA